MGAPISEAVYRFRVERWGLSRKTSPVQADATKKPDASRAEQAELNKRTEAAAVKAKAAQEKAIDAAKEAGVKPPDLQPLEGEAMPRRGLARRSNGTPTQKTQRNFTDADRHLSPQAFPKP